MSTPPDRPEGPSGRSWLRRRSVRACLIVIGLGVAIRALLPWAVEWVIAWQGARATGRVVAVENVDLELLAGRVHLHGLAMAQPLPAAADAPVPALDPGQVVASLGALELDFTWTALPRGEIRLAELVLTQPAVELDRRADGSLAPILLAPRDPAPEPEPEEAEDGAAWPVYVDSFALLQSAVRLLLEGRDDVQVVDLTLQRFGLRDFGLVDGGIQLGAVDIQQPEARVRRDLVVPAAAGPGTGAEPAEAGGAQEPDASGGEPEVAPADEGGPGGDAPDAAGSGGLPGVDVAEIHVERAEFTLATDEHEIDVGLALDAERVRLTEPFPLTLRLDVGDAGGFFALDGRLRAIPLFFDGHVEWAELPLVEMLAVAELEMPLRFEGGSSRADLQVRYGADDSLVPQGVSVSGRVAASGIALAEVVDRLDLAWSDLEVEIAQAELPLGEAARTRGPRVALERLALLSPRLRYTLPERAARPAEAEADSEPPPEPEPPAPPKPTDPRVSLTLLHVSDATLELVDRGVEPDFEAQLRELDLKLRDLAWPEKSLKSVALSARGPGPGRVGLSGGLVGGRGTLALELGGLELPDFDAYVRPALGQGIAQGTLSLHTDLEAEWPDLTARNELVLYQLALSGAEDPDFAARFGVPVAIALALLRDTEGAITLEPEVVLRAGSLRLGPLVREALGEALEGALRAPLKGITALGGVAAGLVPGRDAPAFGVLGMKAGTTSLDAGADARIGAIAQVLAERPTLAVRLSGRADASDDPALAERMLAERALAEQELPRVDGVGMLQRRRIRAALLERGGGEPGPLDPEDEAALARMVGTLPVPEERRLALARARAEAMRQDLVSGHGVAPAQVTLGEPASGRPGVAGDLAAVVPE